MWQAFQDKMTPSRKVVGLNLGPGKVFLLKAFSNILFKPFLPMNNVFMTSDVMTTTVAPKN